MVHYITVSFIDAIAMLYEAAAAQIFHPLAPVIEQTISFLLALILQWTPILQFVSCCNLVLILMPLMQKRSLSADVIIRIETSAFQST